MTVHMHYIKSEFIYTMISKRNTFFIITMLLSGCSSYNEHIDKCAGEKVGSVKRVLSYTPIGAIVGNGLCAIKGDPKKPEDQSKSNTDIKSTDKNDPKS